jgi:MFS family permease
LGTTHLLLRLVPLLTVILIDSISYTIVVPVLAATLVSDHPVLMPGYGQSTRYIVYGVALGIFELMMLYMAPVLGEISDRKGRRSVLIACLVGIVLSFVLIGAAILFDLVALLLLGRILGGAMAGSQAVAQAAAVDLSSEQTKPLALSLCLLASSVGFIVGPLIGGAAFFGGSAGAGAFAIPIGITALLALIGVVLILVWYRDAARLLVAPLRLADIDLLTGVRGIRAALDDPPIRRLIAIFGFMQVAWGTFFLFLPSLFFERFKLDTGTISLIMGLLGIGFCVAYGVCLPWLQKRVSAQTIAVWGLWATAALMLVSLWSFDLAVQWAVAFPIATVVSIAYGAIITQFSDAVDRERQGWILGITISVTAVAWGSSSILAGFLSGLDYMAPFVFALVVLVASAWLATTTAASRSAAQLEGE